MSTYPNPPAQPFPPSPPASPPAGGNMFREYVAAALAIAIVGCTIYLFTQSFSETDPAKSKQESAVLQACLALAGTVTGYYFGRIPGANAQQTNNALQHNLASATALSQQALSNETRIRTQVGALQQQFSGTPVGGAAPGNDPDAMRAHVAQSLGQILRG